MNAIDLGKKRKKSYVSKSTKKAFNRRQDLLPLPLMNTKMVDKQKKKQKKNNNRHFERKWGSNKVFRCFLSLVHLSLEYTHYDFFFFSFWGKSF